MSNGLKKHCKNHKGLTLTEVLLSVLLLSVIILGVSAIYITCQQFYFSAYNNITIAYELQYAIQHMYKNTMVGMGDESSSTSSAIKADYPQNTRYDIKITLSNPPTAGSYPYCRTHVYYRYSPTASLCSYDGLSQLDYLTPKISITSVYFEKAGNLLRGSVTGALGNQSTTLYFASYPREASFR